MNNFLTISPSLLHLDGETLFRMNTAAPLWLVLQEGRKPVEHFWLPGAFAKLVDVGGKGWPE